MNESLEKAYTAALQICANKNSGTLGGMVVVVRKWAYTALSIATLAGLTMGALLLPAILNAWIVLETDRHDIAFWVSTAVFLAFAISLGVVIGVYGYLRGLRRMESPATVREAHRAIRAARQQ